MEQLFFKTPEEWRDWLSRNHGRESGVWLIFYKKGSGEPSLTYEPALDEALCFGWIDSTARGVDDCKYIQKFTPRRERSRWSERNRQRVARLIDQGRMTEAGLAKIEAAKRNGRWYEPDSPFMDLEMPIELKTALDTNEKAHTAFSDLAPSYRKQFIAWIAAAKRPETRERRIREAVDLLEQGRKLGMK